MARTLLVMAASHLPPALAHPGTAPIRVLVAEDESALGQIIACALSYGDMQGVLCHTGAEALARLDTETYDLILLDMHLPVISGLEVLRQVKSDPAHAHVPVIMMSGHFSQAAMAEATRLGAVDFLHKPFDILPFIACLQGHLNPSQRERTELPPS